MSEPLAFTPIRSLVDKENITDRPLLVKDKVLGMGKNGKAFLSLLVGDKSGHIDARVWDRVDEVSDSFSIGDLIKIKGQVQVYQSRKQIIVHKLIKAEAGEFNIEDFTIEEIKIDAHALYAELMSFVNELQTPPIKQLLLDSLQDEEIKSLVLKAPAARSIHHAKKSGLIEHVVSICKIMRGMAAHYKELNSDLLIFGAIFHDLGKIWELQIDRDQIQYTHQGRLLGHMQLACELIDRKSQRILGFPDDLRVILKHIVLSHHGRLEYGSPVRPYIMEAFMVAAIDDLDSKMNTMMNFIKNERETGEPWSRYNDNFERYFYLDNLKDRWKS